MSQPKTVYACFRNVLQDSQILASTVSVWIFQGHSKHKDGFLVSTFQMAVMLDQTLVRWYWADNHVPSHWIWCWYFMQCSYGLLLFCLQINSLVGHLLFPLIYSSAFSCLSLYCVSRSWTRYRFLLYPMSYCYFYIDRSSLGSDFEMSLLGFCCMIEILVDVRYWSLRS